MSGAIPYVIGQWVCGPRFYGREPLLAGILDGPPAWHWIAGLRRIGKTSLLKQLDHLAGARARDPRRWAEEARLVVTGSADRPLLPLFWDLQGVGSAKDLGLTFGEALLDAEERLEELGIAPREIEDGDPFAALEKLARAARGRDAEILLLCDEADALLDLARADPGLSPRLWRAIGAAEPVRVVLASSLRLCDLGLGAAAERAVAGLAERFSAPRLFGAFTDEEARTLLRQVHLPEASRPTIAEAETEAIREQCGNHPMLLQLLAKRLLELRDLDEAFRQVAADPSVGHLFAVDFELLAPEEREVLRAIACEGVRPATDRLLALGLLHRKKEEGHTIANRFLSDWLRRLVPIAD